MDYRPRVIALLLGGLLLVGAAGCRRFGNSADPSSLNAIRYRVHGAALSIPRLQTVRSRSPVTLVTVLLFMNWYYDAMQELAWET